MNSVQTNLSHYFVCHFMGLKSFCLISGCQLNGKEYEIRLRFDIMSFYLCLLCNYNLLHPMFSCYCCQFTFYYGYLHFLEYSPSPPPSSPSLFFLPSLSNSSFLSPPSSPSYSFPHPSITLRSPSYSIPLSLPPSLRLLRSVLPSSQPRMHSRRWSESRL